MPLYVGTSRRTRTVKSLRKRWLAHLGYAAIILFLAGVLYWLRSMLLPFIIAALLAFVFEPVVTALHRLKLPRWCGVVLVYAALIGAIALFTGFLVPIIDVESRKFAEKFQVVLKEAPQVYERLETGVGDLLEGAGAPDEQQQRAEEAPPAPSRDEDWGFGPPVHKVPHVSPLSVPVVPAINLAASDEQLAEAGVPPPPPLSSVRLEGGEARLSPVPGPGSTLTIAPDKQGAWGVRLGTATVEVKKVGEGTYTLSSRDQPYEGSRWGDVKTQVISAMRSGLQQFSTSLLSGFFKFFQGLVAGIFNAIVGIVVVFLAGAFMLIDAPRLMRGLRENVPQRYRCDLDELLGRIESGLSGVVRGQLIICLVNGLLSFVGFYIFIPEYAVVLAILAGVLSLVPIFGTIISSVPAILIALTIGFGPALGVLAWILGIHFIEAYILNPNIIGSQALIHPLVVVFVLIAGEYLYGMKGILLAVPATSLVQSLLQFAYSRIRRHVL